MSMPTVNAAATDPAAVPGLIPPRSPRPEEAVPEPEEPAGAAGDDAGNEGAAVTEEGTADAADVSEDEDAGSSSPAEDGTGDDESAPTADGPVFEAADRLGSVAADHAGLRFRLDDTDAEFTWDEIGAVEYETPRFGRRLTVTVHTRDKDTYLAEVEAPRRGRLKEWTAALDEVLDAYFEE
jgi:hypothetical protein